MTDLLPTGSASPAQASSAFQRTTGLSRMKTFDDDDENLTVINRLDHQSDSSWNGEG